MCAFNTQWIARIQLVSMVSMDCANVLYFFAYCLFVCKNETLYYVQSISTSTSTYNSYILKSTQDESEASIFTVKFQTVRVEIAKHRENSYICGCSQYINIQQSLNSLCVFTEMKISNKYHVINRTIFQIHRSKVLKLMAFNKWC